MTDEELKADRARKYAAEKRRKDADPGRVRDMQRANTYGITLDEVRAIRERQGGACAICGTIPKPDTRGRDGLHLDHRHDNGKVRGMLCTKCNTTLHLIEAPVAELRARLVYILRCADPGSMDHIARCVAALDEPDRVVTRRQPDALPLFAALDGEAK